MGGWQDVEDKSQHHSADLKNIQLKANPIVLFTSMLRFLVQMRDHKYEKNRLVLTFFPLSNILLYLILPF